MKIRNLVTWSFCLCAALAACGSRTGNALSLAQHDFDTRFCKGGWQLYEVWTKDRADSLNTCLIGMHARKFTAEPELYGIGYSPRLVAADGRLRNLRLCSMQPDLGDVTGIYSYNEKDSSLSLKGCLSPYGLPDDYTVRSVSGDTLCCEAVLDNNKVAGIRKPLPCRGKATFLFVHVTDDVVKQWEQEREARKSMIAVAHTGADRFHRLFAEGGWTVEQEHPLYEDSVIGIDRLTREWLGGGTPPYMAVQDGQVCLFYKKNRVTEAPDYTVKTCAYTFDEGSQELALSQRHVRKLIVLNISDSTFTGLELCVPDSSRQQNGALRLIGDTYYPDGYEGRLTGLLRVFRHHGSETVKEWKQKWNLQSI